MKRSLCIVLQTMVAASAVAKIDVASVTMPYAELSALLQRVDDLERQSETLKPTSPVAVLVHSANYTVQCDGPQVGNLWAAFELSNLSESWQSVPLVKADQAIRSVEPTESKIVQVEDMLHLLMEPDSRASVRLELLAGQTVRSRGGRTFCDFYAIPAASSRLQLESGGKVDEIVVEGSVGRGESFNEYGLPSSGGDIRVKRYHAEQQEAARWYAQAQYLVREGEGSFEILCHLRLNAADGGRTSEVELALPTLANLAAVRSDGLAGRHTTEISADGQAIRLRWSEDEVSSRSIDLCYRFPNDHVEKSWTIPGVRVSRANSYSQGYFFGAFDGVELVPGEGEWSTMERMPRWVAESVGTKDLRYLEAGDNPEVELKAKLLPRMEISEATVRYALYDTELVGQGGMLHKAAIEIEHDEMAVYSFNLPEGTRLLSCEVAGRKIAPILEEDGSLRLDLPKRNGGKTPVAYSYTSNGPKLNPVEGKAELVLPLTPLFIHKLVWTVRLPGEYEATALEGNVVIEAGGGAGSPVRLSKQLCHNETPTAALYYTRRDLKDSSKG